MDESEVEDGMPGRKTLLFYTAGVIGVVLMMDLFHWAFGGGGLLSVTSALSAANAQVPTIDVDEGGLQFPAVVLTSLATAGLLWLVPVNLNRRLAQVLVILGMIGGGFALDMTYGPSIIAGQMAGRGYTRCETRDHHVGNGKGRIWFDNYVLHAADCPAERPTS